MMICPICGSEMVGDGFHTIIHCENAEYGDYYDYYDQAPDSNPLECCDEKEVK